MRAVQLEKTNWAPTMDERGEALRPIGPAVEAALAENRQAFFRFLVRRLGDVSTAEDVFQSFCLRVVSRGKELRRDESVIAWLYRVLRSVLTDHYRSEAARQRRNASYAQEQITLGNDRDDVEPEDSICNCFSGLMPTLRRDYAEILRQVYLSGEPREKVAANLGITLANVRVRLHRASQALRKALKECCGSCCEHVFHDCDCQSVPRRVDLTLGNQAARR